MTESSPQPLPAPAPRTAARAPVRLTAAVIEIEKHVAASGWDGPVRLFALVSTTDLLAQQPALAATLELAPEALLDPGHLTPVEQEDLPGSSTLDDLLAGIMWPADVLGAALTVERVMLPPAVEADMPAAEGDALRWIGEHPERQEVRLAVGVLRDGSQECAVRMRAHDSDQAVLSGADLVPGLASALAATLAD